MVFPKKKLKLAFFLQARVPSRASGQDIPKTSKIVVPVIVPRGVGEKKGAQSLEFPLNLEAGH